MAKRQYVFLVLPVMLVFPVLQGACSSPESRERVDILLCWLRPSCLPQERAPSSPVQPQSENSAPSLLQQTRSASPAQGQNSVQKAKVCRTSAEVMVPSQKSVVAISYEEPTTTADGQPLTNLAKTTIYYDLGKGLVKYKEIVASDSNGGGKVTEKINLPEKNEESVNVTICVTATNTHGRER
jgi:hypothetical protein